MYNISVKAKVGNNEEVVFKCVAHSLAEVRSKIASVYGENDIQIVSVGYIQEILANE